MAPDLVIIQAPLRWSPHNPHKPIVLPGLHQTANSRQTQSAAGQHASVDRLAANESDISLKSWWRGNPS